jgi:hypothetical protein
MTIQADRENSPRAQPARAAKTFNELRFVPLVLIATIAGVLLATARYGMGLTPDSVVYIFGARSLTAGHGYTNNGRAITDFPPGYSAVLSAAHHLGIGEFDAARVIAVLGFVVTVVLGYILLRRHCASPAVRLGATTLLGCSAVLLDVYEKALSEHLFIPVTLVFVLVLELQMVHPRRPTLFIASVLCAWAAFYLRYIGIVLIIVGALVLLIAMWRRSRLSAFGLAIVYAAVAASAPIAWMVRNTHGGGDALGHRASASVTVFTNASRILKQVGTWVVTDAGPSALRALVLLIVLGFVAALVWRAHRTRSAARLRVRPLLPLILFVVVYVVYLAGSASVIAFGAISNTRFMVPVYVPLVVLAAWGFEQLRARLDDATLVRVLNWAAIVFLAVNVLWFTSRALDSARNGAGGYATAQYHNSKILGDVRNLDLSVTTFSNDAPAIALFTGRTVQPAVARTFFHSDDQTGKLSDFVHLVNCRGDAHLVWFLPNPRPYLYTPAQLSKQLSLHTLVKHPDGTIYDLRPLPGATCG